MMINKYIYQKKIIIKNMTGGRFNECHLIQAAADDDDVKKQQLE